MITFMKSFFAVALFALVLFTPQLLLAADFQALTSIPGIQQAANSRNLAAFLNTLYMLCVGAAAILAVLKIVQGGVTYMLGDSITEKREARHHITLAVLGLVLVLAPALVFGIIDPDILRLNVDLTGLRTEATGPATTSGGSDVTWVSTNANDAATCQSQGGVWSTESAGTYRCSHQTAHEEEYPVGSTAIPETETNACRAQQGCEVHALPRSQYSCVCTAPTTEN